MDFGIRCVLEGQEYGYRCIWLLSLYSATADLNVGVVTRNQYADPITIRAKSLGDQRYAAIIVPQRINNRQPFLVTCRLFVNFDAKFKN